VVVVFGVCLFCYLAYGDGKGHLVMFENNGGPARGLGGPEGGRRARLLVTKAEGGV